MSKKGFEASQKMLAASEIQDWMRQAVIDAAGPLKLGDNRKSMFRRAAKALGLSAARAAGFYYRTARDVRGVELANALLWLQRKEQAQLEAEAERLRTANDEMDRLQDQLSRLVSQRLERLVGFPHPGAAEAD